MNARGIDLKLNVEGDDLAEFEKFTGKPLPVAGPFGLSGHFVSPSDNEVQVSDLLVVLGESHIQGTVKITGAAKRPFIEAKFTSKKLDMRPVLADNKASDGKQKRPAGDGSRSDKVFSAQTFDLSILQNFDATISLRVNQVIGLISALDNLYSEITLQNGHLLIKPVTADVGGGKFSAGLDLVTQDNTARVKTKITAQNINLGEMLKKMDISDEVEGSLDMDIDLDGQGNSVASLMAGLNGYFTASTGKGKMPVKYLNLIGANLGTNLMTMVNPLEDNSNRAQINCSVCDFDIKDGIAKCDAMIIDDPQKTLISSGTLNLKTEALDFGIETKPKGGIGTKETGKVNISLSQITKPFKLGGTLANPSLGISPERVATILGRALLAPGGIPSLFVSASQGGQNPCLLAVKKIKEPASGDETKSSGKKDQGGSGTQKKEGLGSKILNLFSKPKE